ncbi:MAG: serine kinase [Alphaproteobacteria bacterium]|nr:MAG: serine kinase [Alphaproteobacteria bacterium]
MVTGPSGSGKSSLCLQLIALGARLIADDLTRLVLRDGWPWACAPPRLSGVVEARGIGLLRVPFCEAAPLALVVDLEVPETERLPKPAFEKVLGTEVARLQRVDAPHFPSAIMALAKGGRVDHAG